MRILHVIPSIDKKSGGPAKAIWDYINLTKDVFDYEIFTTNEGLTNDEISELSSKNGIQIHAYDYIGRHSFKFSYKLLLSLLKHAITFEYVYIHAGFSIISQLAALICILVDQPYIYRPLGTLSPYSLKVGKSFIKKLMLPFERQILKSAEWVHCTSLSEKHDIKHLNYRIKIYVIPPPVETQTREEKLISKPIRLGLMSRIHPKKNISFILEAMSKVNDKSAFELYLAGEGDPIYLNEIHKLVHKLGLEKQVHLVGFITDEEKKNYFSSLHWFVLPSFHENFGIAVAEAMSFGVPCFTSVHVDATEFNSSTHAIIREELDLDKWVIHLNKIATETQEEYSERSKDAYEYIAHHFSQEQIKLSLIKKVKSYF